MPTQETLDRILGKYTDPEYFLIITSFRESLKQLKKKDDIAPFALLGIAVEYYLDENNSDLDMLEYVLSICQVLKQQKET